MTSAASRWKTLRQPSPPATVDPQGALSAVRTSRAALAAEVDRHKEVKHVTRNLRELREKNHFADLILETMQPNGA